MRKSVLLEHVPPVLVLQLKRFSFDALQRTPVKIDARVHYPKRLTLAPQHLSSDLQDQVGGAVQYELRAAVLHHGAAATGGHYTCVCRDDFAQWRHFDDAKVSAVSEEQALGHGSRVYLLLYTLLQ